MNFTVQPCEVSLTELQSERKKYKVFKGYYNENKYHTHNAVKRLTKEKGHI